MNDNIMDLITQAIAWSKQGKLTEAINLFRRVLAEDPNNFDGLQGMGIVHYQMRDINEALRYIALAYAVRPNNFLVNFNLGKTLDDLERYQEALASYDKSISLEPRYAPAHYNRGLLLQKLERHQEAVASYDKAVFLKSDRADIHSARGVALVSLKRYEEALSSFDQAIVLRPDYAEARYNKGFLKLLLGHYKEGWPLYEWRWKIDAFKEWIRGFKQPLWLGDPAIAGKTILLYSEQGLGDVIQFARYVPMVEALGAKVVLQVPAPLVPLLSTLKGACTLLAKGDELPVFELHCPLMSLPLAFATTVETIPSAVPYLSADPHKRRVWRERLGAKTRPRIGLAWSGYAGYKNDRNRSVALRILERSLPVDFEYHSLQKEIRPEDEAILKQNTQIRSHKHEINDFADTAALIAEMDLVISVDTSVAHLAGALGQVIWVMLPYNPDWRWMPEGSDSPWYPTLRLFRMPQPHDWDGVLARIESELIRFAAAISPR